MSVRVQVSFATGGTANCVRVVVVGTIFPDAFVVSEEGIFGAGLNVRFSGIEKAELDALRKEVLELKELLMAAKKFDAATGQPDCEMDAKVKLIKELAKLFGIDLGDVFGGAKPSSA